MITADIIIPVYFAPELTIRCIQSVIENTDFTDINVKVVVVDDSGSSQNTQTLRYFFNELNISEKIEFIVHEKNQGFIEACYTGIEYRKSDYKILLNSDTFVTKNWLNLMIETAESDDAIALVNPSTNQSPEIHVLMPPGHNIHTMHTFFSNHIPQEEDHIDLVTSTGFCLLIKSKYIDKFGFFDRIFDKGYCEETDLYFRYITQGLRGVLCPKAFVYHRGEASFSDRSERYLMNQKILMSRYESVYMGTHTEFNEKTVLNRLKKQINKQKTVDIDVLLISPSNALSNGGIKIIHNICNALNEAGVSATMACQNIITPKTLEDRLYMPILLEDFFKLNIKPKVLVFSLIYNARQVAEIVEHIKTQDNSYNPVIVHMMQDVESWFEGHNHSDLEVCTAIAGSKLIVSPFIEKYFENTVNKGIDSEMIKNSISLDFLNLKDSEPKQLYTICTMLRKDQKRGAVIIEEAIKKVAESLMNKEIQLITFGDYDKLPTKLPNITIINKGVVSESEVCAILKKSDLFIEGSLFQGYGMTSMESLFAGCEVISSANQGAISVLPESDMVEYFQIGNSSELSQMILNKINSWDKKNKQLDLKQVYENSSRNIFPKYATYFKRIIQNADKLVDQNLYRKFYMLERKLDRKHLRTTNKKNTSTTNEIVLNKVIQSYKMKNMLKFFIKRLKNLRNNSNIIEELFYYDIEIEEKDNNVHIKGWCFYLIEEIDKIEIVTKKDGTIERSEINHGMIRSDVKDHFKIEEALNSGFYTKIPITNKSNWHSSAYLEIMFKKTHYRLKLSDYIKK